jgi:DNA-binding beta-propeller fold protein YncE
VSGYVDATALNAKFRIVDDMKVDSSGNFYVVDSGNNKLRKIDTALSVTTIPGTNFNVPTSVALDSSGNIYVVEVGGFVTQIKP